jgi:hypothetical protein
MPLYHFTVSLVFIVGGFSTFFIEPVRMIAGRKCAQIYQYQTSKVLKRPAVAATEEDGQLMNHLGLKSRHGRCG